MTDVPVLADAPDPVPGSPPAGPMAAFAGPLLDPQTLLAVQEYLNEREVERMAGVRAFEVPALEGAAVEAEGEHQLITALVETLDRALPGTGWQWRILSEAGPVAVLRKYCLLHTAFAAPPDEATGQPMVMQVCSRAVTFAGRDAIDVISSRVTLPDRMDTPVPGPIVAELGAAVWANVLWLQYKMPWYM